jgi:hypothetical protein
MSKEYEYISLKCFNEIGEITSPCLKPTAYSKKYE